ncbi:MAG: hypothetical protein FWE33_01705 [Defluviitaleaceae bacterium]|nr:hypothetical protein [Defluviitaleaceae bacterium]
MSLLKNKALRRNKALITLSGNDGNLKDDVVVSSASGAKHSRVGQVLNGISHNAGKIATMERGLWRLDGSFMLPVEAENSQIEVGFVSDEIANENGAFANRPEIVIDFDTPRDVPVVNIVCDRNNAPIRFAQAVFRSRSGSVIRNVFISSAPDESGVFPHIIGTDGANGVSQIVITVYNMVQPHRRARVTEVHFAPVVVFDGGDLLEVNAIHQGDVEGKNLPYNELRVKVANSNGRFNLLDVGDGLFSMLEEGSRLEYAQGVGYGSDGGMIYTNFSQYYLDRWVVSNDNVEMVAHSGAKMLDNAVFYGGHFGLEHMGDLARRIAAEAGVEVVVPHIMNTYPRFPGFTGNVSHRRALADLAKLASCGIYEDRQGRIHFVDLFSIHQGELKADLDYGVAYAKPQISQSHYYNGIMLTERMISLDQGWLANVQLDVAGSLDVMIPYDAPIWGEANVSVTGGFGLQNLQRHTMYMTARVVGNGRCTVEVRGWRCSILSTQHFYFAPWKKEGEAEKPYMVDLPMFISNAVHIQSVRDWFLERKFRLLRALVFAKVHWRGDVDCELGDNFMLQVDKDGRMVRCRAFYQEIGFDGGVFTGATKAVVIAT